MLLSASMSLYAQELKSTPDSSVVVGTETSSGIGDRGTRSGALDEMRRLIAEDMIDYGLIFPGLQALDYGSLGQFSLLSFNGVSPAATALRFGDLVLSDPILGVSGPVAVPIHLIEGLSESEYIFDTEVIPGIGGEIALQPLSFAGNHPYSRVFFRAGDWGYSDLGVLFGLPISESAKLMIAGDRQEYDGFTQNMGHTGSRILTGISYRPHASFELKYTSFLFKNDVKVPAPLLPDLFPYPANAGRKENRWQQALTVRCGRLEQDSRQFDVNLNVMRLKQKATGDSLLFDNRNIRIGLEVGQRFAVGSHVLGFGGTITADRLRSDRLGDRADYHGYGAFRYAYRSGGRTAVSGQIGIQKHDDFKLDWVAAGHINVALSQDSRFWMGAKKAVRYPTFAERYWQSSFFVGMPQLAAEEGYTAEIGYGLQIPQHLLLQTRLFTRRVDDWIGEHDLADVEDRFGPQNLGKRTVRGVDAKFVWTIFPDTEVGLFGSYLNVAEDAPEKQLQIPEFAVYSFLETGHLFFDDFVFIRLRVSSRLFGERHGLFFASSTSPPDRAVLNPDALLDTKLSFEFSNAALYVSWENLLDRRYQLVPGFFMPPRTLRFGVDWEFLD